MGQRPFSFVEPRLGGHCTASAQYSSLPFSFTQECLFMTLWVMVGWIVSIPRYRDSMILIVGVRALRVVLH
ncbi:hypothetical protein BDV19DRAFT_206121 [Aspergillus venezuelensis]